MTITDSTPVLVLWWIALVLTVLVIVPVALWLLHRAARAAFAIRRYADETRAAAEGIVANARAIAALDETIEATAPIAGKAERLEAATGRIEAILKSRTARGGER